MKLEKVKVKVMKKKLEKRKTNNTNNDSFHHCNINNIRESEGKSDEEETRQGEEESFDPIPKTPEESKEESNDEEDQELRLSEEERIQEEEDADELYRDININQGRGLQVTQNVEDSHMTLTPVNPDGTQESLSMSSFMTIHDPANEEGDFKRLRLQDIEDMLLLLVQMKLSNLTVEERLAFNVSLRMFTRSIVIKRRVEDLQLGAKSYQKKLNLTKPDTYRPDLRRREAYTA
nr:hypothetical protein [Tanacetum cinerariifolium]